MLITPENNVSLTDLQTARLEEAKNRLLNFETEISIAQKNIKILKSETENVFKDKAYQEKLLSVATENTKHAQSTLEALHQEISLAQDTLSKCHAETLLINEANAAKASEFSEREKTLEAREIDHTAKVEHFTTQSAELAKDKLFVETTKEAFLKALDVMR